MIRFENFSKAYRGFVAAHDISFTADVGRATVLLGENGAGKTTVLHACLGLHYATEGKVFVGGTKGGCEIGSGTVFDVAKNPAAAKNLVGYVPETPVLCQDMTVSEFVTASALIHCVPRDDAKDFVLRAMTLCGLLEVSEKKIKTLSKGFRQRLSLAAVLAFDPPNIVMDEPASGLDPTQMGELRKIICKLAETKTVLLSTHLIPEAAALKPNILIMHKGSVVANGDEQKICHKAKASSEQIPTLEEAFVFFTSRGAKL